MKHSTVINNIDHFLDILDLAIVDNSVSGFPVIYCTDVAAKKGVIHNMDTVLVKEFRANQLECIHRGSISIVNNEGKVIQYAGDPHYIAFTRSSAKPIQAIPGVRAGIIEHYGLSEADIAVMVASHRGEEDHMGTLNEMLQKIGVDEQKLVCAPSLPLNQEATINILRHGGDRRRLYHNCSGKHLGALAYSQMKGYSLEDYADPQHPVQQEIVQTLAQLANLSQDDITIGVDGCGFPVFALPLSALATAYMKLANPQLIQDQATATAVATITKVMNKHPRLVAGTGMMDSILLEDDNIVAKGGFKGVYAFALKKEQLGITFKIADGSEEEWGLVVTSILEQLQYERPQTIQKLKQAFPNSIYNDAGNEVGMSICEFKLERH